MSNWKRPPIYVGMTVTYYKFRTGEPRAMIVTRVNEKTLNGISFSPTGHGFSPVDCVYHVDDPELEIRPQMQENMWDYTEHQKMVTKIWEHLDLGDATRFAPAVHADPSRLEKQTVQEMNERDKITQMLHAGCTDEGRICKETGAHHMTVKSVVREFVKKKREISNA